MDRKMIGYWATTGLFCLAMLGGGIGDLFHVESLKEEVMRLGYPEYLLTILGVAKLSGAVVVGAPGLPRLKEWAYAGFTADLLGATVSHAFVGDPLPTTLRPALILCVGLASWALRPDDRRLADPSQADAPRA